MRRYNDEYFKIKQALNYQLSYFAWSSLWVYGIAIALMCILGAWTVITVNDVNVSTGLGGVAFVHLLVFGIGIRGDLKFYTQHGISRRTTFLSHLYGSLICAVAVGLLCSIFNVIAGRWLGFSGGYEDHNIINFLTDWIMYISVFIFAWQIGTLISMIFYRLNNLQKVVFSVLSIGFLIFAFVVGIRYIVNFTEDFEALVIRLTEGAFAVISPTLIITFSLAILAMCGNYLLLRRSPIKE